MAKVKVIIYRYVDLDQDEEVTDYTGDELPPHGAIVFRKDKAWKVDAVYNMPLKNPYPRYRIHLVDMSNAENAIVPSELL